MYTSTHTNTGILACDLPHTFTNTHPTYTLGVSSCALVIAMALAFIVIRFSLYQDGSVRVCVCACVRACGVMCPGLYNLLAMPLVL